MKFAFQRSSYYLGLLFIFSLPLFVKALPVIIAAWVLSLIIEAFLNRKIQLNLNIPAILLLVLYVFYVSGMLWSADKNTCRFALEVKFSLFLFPVIVASNKLFFKENFIKLLLAFIFGCIATALICMIVALRESIIFTATGIRFDTIDPDYANWEFGGSHFRYINLSLFLHPTYFSLYLLFALISIVVILRQKIISNRHLIYTLNAAKPLFLFMIYLLSSKAGLISAVMLLIFYSAILFKRHSQRLINIVTVLITLVLVFITLQNPRFSTIADAIQNPEIIDNNSSDGSLISRFHIWKAGIEVVRENFFSGVGPGDTNDALVKKYENYHFRDPFRIRANAHNQFLETFIDLGLIGFLILVGVLVFPIRKSFQEENIIFLLFLMLTGFNFLFESMLNTQAGVIFFGFFYCVLSITDKSDIRLKAGTITQRHLAN